MQPIQDAYRSTTPERGPSSTRRPETCGRHRAGRRPGPRWRAAACGGDSGRAAVAWSRRQGSATAPAGGLRGLRLAAATGLGYEVTAIHFKSVGTQLALGLTGPVAHPCSTSLPSSGRCRTCPASTRCGRATGAGSGVADPRDRPPRRAAVVPSFRRLSSLPWPALPRAASSLRSRPSPSECSHGGQRLPTQAAHPCGCP
jgi:hypothetical protein